MGAWYSENDPRRELQEIQEAEDGGSFNAIISSSPQSQGEATQKAIRKATQVATKRR